MLMKLAYCGTCNPVVAVGFATEFSVKPVHMDQKTGKVHAGVVVDVGIDLSEMLKPGVIPGNYLSEQIAKALPKKV